MLRSERSSLPLASWPSPLTRLCLVLLLCSIACGSAAAAPVRLVLWGMESGADSQDADAKIAAFEQRHPSIHVSALSMGAGAMTRRN